MLLGGIRFGRFLLQVLEDLLNHLRILDTGNNLNLATAVFADLDVDVEHSFEALHPGHSAMALCGAFVTPVGIGRLRIGFLAAFGGCHLN